MKKTVLLLVVIALLLCSCGKTSNEPEVTIPTQVIAPSTSEVTEPTAIENVEIPDEDPVYTQQPMAAVSMPIHTEYVTDGDTTVYYYTYQDIYVNVQDQQVADTIIIDYLNRRDQFSILSQSLAKDAEKAFNGNTNWNPHFFESVYSPTRADLGVLSLFGHNVIYAGGNHPELECIAANYNMITGEVLTLGSILCSESSIEPLRKLVTDQMAEQKERYSLFADYADTVQQRFSREASYDEDWFFSTNGLCFFFAPYEVAPYISGIVTVEVPYSMLTGIISDEFFPAETDGSTGTVLAQQLAKANIEGFTQIAEVPLSEVGEQVFLSCDGLVRNVRLDYGYWNEDGSVYSVQATVFASHTLSPGDGILVTTDIPDTMPTLRLSYDSGTEQISVFISQSGEDGSILLLNS